MEQHVEEKKKTVAKKKGGKKGTRPHVKAKKKTAVARAVAKSGTGRVHINKMNVSTISSPYVRSFIEEPMHLAGPVGKEVDIDVTVSGGGFMGQAVASRSAIAKALVQYAEDENLEKRMTAFDRLLLVDDPRRKEPKKPLGRGARKAKQLSFR